VYKTVLTRQLLLKYFKYIQLVFPSSHTPLITSLLLEMLLLRSLFSLITLLFTLSFLGTAEPLHARAQGIETTTKTVLEVSSPFYAMWNEDEKADDSQRHQRKPISKPAQKPPR
jgi:hypothetical protein